jgi:hypothetical protein
MNAQTYLVDELVNREKSVDMYICVGALFANYEPSYSSASSPSYALPKTDWQPGGGAEQPRSAKKVVGEKRQGFGMMCEQHQASYLFSSLHCI